MHATQPRRCAGLPTLPRAGQEGSKLTLSRRFNSKLANLLICEAWILNKEMEDSGSKGVTQNEANSIAHKHTYVFLIYSFVILKQYSINLNNECWILGISCERRISQCSLPLIRHEVKQICFNFRQTGGPGAEICHPTDVKHWRENAFRIDRGEYQDLGVKGSLGRSPSPPRINKMSQICPSSALE